MESDPLDITILHSEGDQAPSLNVKALREALDACQSASSEADFNCPNDDESASTTLDASTNGSPNGTSIDDGSHYKSLVNNNEVNYSDGGTPLFKAIESVKWREALVIAEKHPDQIRTWVKSTGTENTTFDWSLWKRLPIHEACRRQAPAWLVSTLLSYYPESAACKTQFDELPLHLAVGCGSAPEVVNLIIVANWEGIIAQDKTGRTPMEIWNESELLVHDDHRVVYESLTRCYNTFMQFQNQWHGKMEKLQKRHEMTIMSMNEQHDDDIRTEKAKQRDLEIEVTDLYDNIERVNKELSEKEEKILNFAQVERTWYDRVEDLNKVISQLKKEKKEEQETVDALHLLLKEKESQLSSITSKERGVENDLAQIMNWYNSTDEYLGRTQRHLQKLVDSYVQIHGKLMDEKDSMKKMIKARSIDVNTSRMKPSSSRSVGSNYSSSSKNRQQPQQRTQDDGYDTNEAANAAAAAAIAALRESKNS